MMYVQVCKGRDWKQRLGTRNQSHRNSVSLQILFRNPSLFFLLFFLKKTPIMNWLGQPTTDDTSQQPRGKNSTAQNRPDLSRSLDRLLSRSRPPPPPPPPPRPRSLDRERRSRERDRDLCLQPRTGKDTMAPTPQHATHRTGTDTSEHCSSLRRRGQQRRKTLPIKPQAGAVQRALISGVKVSGVKRGT